VVATRGHLATVQWGKFFELFSSTALPIIRTRQLCQVPVTFRGGRNSELPRRGFAADGADKLSCCRRSTKGTPRGRIGDPGEDDFDSVVVDDCLGERAVAGLELGEVLSNGDELDADSSSGGGELGKVREGCNVGCLVDHQ